MYNSKNISITGGSGHLGSCLIPLLLKQGYRVTALYHKTKPNYKHDKLKWISGSIINEESLDQLIKDTSALIHAASLISLGDKEKEKVYSFNVTGTEKVVASCIKHNVKLIYISSTAAVLETIKFETFDENRPYKTENDFLYGWTKALSEKIILSAVNNNLDAFILRPSAIIGPPDYKPSHFGTSIISLYESRIPIITNGGYNIVDVRDVSQTIINSITLGKCGEIYLICGKYHKLKEIVSFIHPKKKYFVLPISTLIFFYPIIILFIKLFQLNYPLTKESLFTVKNAPKNMDYSKAKNNLNHKPRPIEQTFKDVLDWFKNQNKI